MKRFMRIASITLLAAILLTSTAVQAQTPTTPRINYIMPMGGQAGSTFEMKVNGQNLLDVEGLHFNFPGVKTELLGTDKAPVDKRGGRTAPQLATVNFKVTLPPGAPLGNQDVRIIAKGGISNPRVFVVGELKEFVEKEPNDDVGSAQNIDLNSTVNGVISAPQDVDFYRFTGKKGDRVVCSCLTTSIDSKLPVELQLYSSDDTLLGSNRNYSRSDALLDAVLPADGSYCVRVCSFAYALGGSDYFYRLNVSTAPWIDAVFPPVVEPGKDTQVTVYGRNLPGGKLDAGADLLGRKLEQAVINVKVSGDPMALQRLAYSGVTLPYGSMIDGFDLRVKNKAGASNPFLMTYAPAPVVLDNGDNDEQARAQKVPVPCVIAGRIEKKADRDWYAFSAKKGEVWVIDAFADRLGSPVDLFFQLRDKDGKVIAERDDTTDMIPNNAQFLTRNDDPLPFRFVAPADGVYFLMVSSREAFSQFSPRHLYTVRITAEERDFRLIAMAPSQTTPETVSVSQGGGSAYNVYVVRFGFNGDIMLTGEDLPPGVKVVPQRITPSQKLASMVVHADAGAKPWAGPIKIVGTAVVDNKKLVREVRAASIVWPVQQNTASTMGRLDRELVLSVRDKAPYRLAIDADKIMVRQGEKVTIPVSLVADAGFKSTVSIGALNGPAGAISPPLSLTASAKSGKLTLDTKSNQPMLPGNYTIFLRGQTQPVAAMTNPAQGAPPNLVQVSLPVSVTIIPKQLAKLSLPKTLAKLQAGKDGEVIVQVGRLYEFSGAFKVEAIIPPELKGISAAEATIKPDEDQTRLRFTVSPLAPIGSNPTIIIRATAIFNDAPVVHETKLVLSIMK